MQRTPINPDKTKLKCPCLINVILLGGPRQHGRERRPSKLKITCFIFWSETKYPVGVVLSLPKVGSALAGWKLESKQLGIRVQFNITFQTLWI